MFYNYTFSEKQKKQICKRWTALYKAYERENDSDDERIAAVESLDYNSILYYALHDIDGYLFDCGYPLPSGRVVSPARWEKVPYAGILRILS